MAVDALAPYDSSNVFARILRRELPATIVYEDDHVLAFNDIAPIAPVHVLVIPKGAYVSMADFTEHAEAAEIAGFFRAVARQLDLTRPGYRLLANIGTHSGQEVPHMHVHLFAGRWLGPMLTMP